LNRKQVLHNFQKYTSALMGSLYQMNIRSSETPQDLSRRR